MKENVSALMDGQLAEHECKGCFDSLKRDAELRQSWDLYHLIGDAMRGHTAGALSRSFDERLEREPVILAPQRKKISSPMRWTMSAAASLAAVGAVAWMAQPFFFGGQNEQIASTQPVPQAAEVMVLPAAAHNLDDYQLAHQRFAPGLGASRVSPYVRTVASEGGQR